jgi:hypothetical protein
MAVEAEVITTMNTLHHLKDSDYTAFYDLVQKARPQQQKWSDIIQHRVTQYEYSSEVIKNKLVDLRLVESDGTLRESTRQILLSAVEGDSLNMRLVDPKAQEQ